MGTQRPHPDGRHAHHQAPLANWTAQDSLSPGALLARDCSVAGTVTSVTVVSGPPQPSGGSLHHHLRDTPEGAWQAPNGEMGPCDSPNRMEEILLWAYMVKPSFSQNSPQLALVTRFPNQLWAISWMMTSARERSPARRQGVTKVRQGFSIPPERERRGHEEHIVPAGAGGYWGWLPPVTRRSPVPRARDSSPGPSQGDETGSLAPSSPRGTGRPDGASCRGTQV